jgi:hypothetical protein
VVSCQAYASETQHGCWILTWCMVIHLVWLAFSTELNTQEVAKVGRPIQFVGETRGHTQPTMNLERWCTGIYLERTLPYTDSAHLCLEHPWNWTELLRKQSHHITIWVSAFLEMIRPVKTMKLDYIGLLGDALLPECWSWLQWSVSFMCFFFWSHQTNGLSLPMPILESRRPTPNSWQRISWSEANPWIIIRVPAYINLG